GQGRLHVALADGADGTLRLRDDHVGTQLAQHVGADAVDRQGLLDDGLDALVDVAAGAVDVELRLGTDGQVLDGGRVVALVGTDDEALLEADGADNFGGTGEQGNDAWHATKLRLEPEPGAPATG